VSDKVRFAPDSLLERDGFETSVPGERAYGLNLCLSPYELPFSGAQLLGLKGAHQMKWPALAGLPRVLAESDADPVAVPPGSIEQNCEVTIKEGMLDETTLNW
jgi:hypothetical protein